jgi:hypothetical protein
MLTDTFRSGPKSLPGTISSASSGCQPSGSNLHREMGISFRLHPSSKQPPLFPRWRSPRRNNPTGRKCQPPRRHPSINPTEIGIDSLRFKLLTARIWADQDDPARRESREHASMVHVRRQRERAFVENRNALDWDFWPHLLGARHTHDRLLAHIHQQPAYRSCSC